MPWDGIKIAHNMLAPQLFVSFRQALKILGVCALGEVDLDYDQAPNAETCSAEKSLLVKMCILTHQYALPIIAETKTDK